MDHRRKGRPCKFESLEQRNLLAGDVTARIHNGDLVIKGDDLANGITITAGATAGTVVVTGMSAGGSPTNVADVTNGPATGTANGTVTLTGFTGDVKINMKDGDDTVSITDLTIPDDLEFEGGEGNDTLALSGGTIGDSLKVNLGEGDDTLTVDDTTVADEAKIKTKRGEDDATITDSTFDELKVKMGKDDDHLAISGTTVHDETKLNGKKGTNILTQGAGNSLGDLTIKHFQSNSESTTVDLNTVTAITEGSSATLTGSFTDADLTGTHTLTTDWGDPNNIVDSTFAVPASSGLAVNQTINSSTDSAVLTITAINSTTGQVTFSVQHKYADDGVSPSNNTASDTNTITVTVKYSNSLTESDTTTVTVNNAAPTVALNAVTAISENNTATLTGSFTDIGLSDGHTMTVNWGDPNNVTNSTFTFAATSGLSVNQTINASSADATVLTITAVNTTTGQVTFSLQHKYADDGVSPGNTTTSDNSTITVTVADDDTGSGNGTTTVTVNNTAPTVALNSVTAISENNTATLTGSFTDVGISDPHTVTVNWGDANNSTNSTFTVPVMSALAVNQTINSSSTDGAVLTITAINTTTGQVTFSVQHKYLDDGVSPGNTTTSDTSTITVTVADDDGQNGSNTTTVAVSNVAPTVALDAVSAINENGTATLTGSFTDVGISDAHTVTVNWGDPNNVTNSTFAVSATSGLAVNQAINSSSTDGAVLTITAINTTTGQVTFSVQHKYLDDGASPGNTTTSDTNTITVTVADDDGQNGSNTTTVTVSNVAPTVALNAVSEINENGTATLAGTYTDVGLSDVHAVTVNWGDANSATNSVFTVPATSSLVVNQTVNSTSGDGAVLTITAINASTGQVSFSVQHKYADDGVAPGNSTDSDSNTITVTVADDDGQNGSNTTTVTVNNVAPDVGLNSVSAINENGTATLTGNFTDIGLSDVHTLTVDWDDANNGIDSTFTVPATSGLAVNQTISATSADAAVLTITAINAATGQVSFSVQHRYADDGLAPGNNTTSDSSTIKVTIADDDTGSTNTTTTVLVNNVAPAVALNAVPAINENGTATLTGSFTDVGLSDVHTMTVNWGDPTSTTNSTFTVPVLSGLAINQTIISSSGDGAVLTIAAINAVTGQVSFSVQHKYVDDGPFPNITTSDTSTISVTVADDDTGSGSNTTTVLVNNVAPTVALDAVSAIDENGIATLTGSFTDIGLSDTHALNVEWGDPNNSDDSLFTIDSFNDPLSVGDTFDSLTDSAVLTITALNAATGQVSFSVQHQYLDDGEAPGNNLSSDTNTITVTVDDDDSGSGSDTASVTVNNVAPTVDLITMSAIDENDTDTLTGSYTDIGLSDKHTVTVDWDDANNGTDSTFSVPATNRLAVNQTFNSTTDNAILTITAIGLTTGEVSFSVQHKYLDDGDSSLGNNTASDTSTVTVTVADDDLDSGSDTSSVTVFNVTPTVSLNSVSGISEHGTVTLTGSYTDIGLLDEHTLTVNWGDPNNSINSTFSMDDFQDPLQVNDTINSSTDSAVFTITALDSATGQVSFSVQHKYLDDGPAPNNTASDIGTIAVTVTDDDGQSSSDSRFVTISNVTPSVSLNSVVGVSENGTVTLTGSYTDIGLLDAHTLTVNWGDPNNSVNSTFEIDPLEPLSVGDTITSTDGAVLTITALDDVTGQVGFSVQHKYLDDGPAPNNTASDISTIAVTVTDDDGQSSSDSRFVTISNVTPTVSLNSVVGVSENGTVTLTGSFTDIGLLDAHTLSVNWGDANSTNSTFAIGPTSGLVTQPFNSLSGDGAVLTVTAIDAVTGQISFSVQHQYLDDGDSSLGNNTDSDISTIAVTVTDDDGQSGSSTRFVTVSNVMPTVSLDSVSGISENGTATLTGSFTDIGRLDAHTLTVNWGDPNNDIESTFAVGAIRNAAGAATLVVGGTVDSSTDGAVLTVTAIDATTGQVNFSVQHRYVDDGLAPGNNTESDISTIAVTVADDDGQSGASSRFITVNNVVPSVALNAVAGTVDSPATLSGTFTDIGVQDEHTLTIDWDDPNNANDSIFADIGAVQTLNVNDTFTSTGLDNTTSLKITSINTTTGAIGFEVTHTYTAASTRTIEVIVKDDDLGQSVAATATAVIAPAIVVPVII